MSISDKEQLVDSLEKELYKCLAYRDSLVNPFMKCVEVSSNEWMQSFVDLPEIQNLRDTKTMSLFIREWDKTIKVLV